MKNAQNISLIFLMILFFAACGKLIDEFYLTTEEKAQIPFKGFETITFIDDSNNLFVLSGDDRFNQIMQQDECINCRDYYIFERESISFRNNNYELRLVVGSGVNANHFSIGYDIDELSFHSNLISPLSKETLSNNEVYYDSLIVNNKSYNNVFSDSLTHQGSINIDPYPIRYYYSKEYGIIKIDFEDGSVWKLMEIIP
ncbi:hypothetical protein KQH26_00280 [bacterium]|nr:hypothetical protein [bacterium]